MSKIDEIKKEISYCDKSIRLDYAEWMLQRIDRLTKALEEIALPPYKDSDIKSLLETLRSMAREALKEDS